MGLVGEREWDSVPRDRCCDRSHCQAIPDTEGETRVCGPSCCRANTYIILKALVASNFSVQEVNYKLLVNRGGDGGSRQQV